MSRRRIALAMYSIAPLAGGCARSAPAPAPTPAPAPVAAAPIAPRELIVSHRVGRASYEYSAVATVMLEGDTSRAGERVSTSAAFTLAVSGTEPSLRATVTVDSFAVMGGARVGPTERLRAPVRFDATIDASDGRIRIDDPLPPDCASPSTAARRAARVVLLSLPPSLVLGTTWSDSATSESCRGGLVIRARTETRYVVEALNATLETAPAGADLVRVSRRSTSTLSGTPGIGTQGPTLSGSGDGTATLLVDPRTGRLVALDGESVTQIAISNGTRTQKMQQRVTEQLRTAKNEKR